MPISLAVTPSAWAICGSDVAMMVLSSPSMKKQAPTVSGIARDAEKPVVVLPPTSGTTPSMVAPDRRSVSRSASGRWLMAPSAGLFGGDQRGERAARRNRRRIRFEQHRIQRHHVGLRAHPRLLRFYHRLVLVAERVLEDSEQGLVGNRIVEQHVA